MKSLEDDKQACSDAIAAMEPADRKIAERLDTLVTRHAPGLHPRTWYGMPAYANEAGKVVCFFRDRKKFGERFMTFGFNDSARIDEGTDGTFWPLYYAITELTPDAEATLAGLLEKA